MSWKRLRSPLVICASVGLALGLMLAVAEAVASWSAPGEVVRLELLLYGAVFDGGAGLLAGLVIGAAVWALLRLRRALARRAAPAAVSEDHLAAAPDLAGRRLTRREVLRAGLVAGSAVGIGALALEWGLTDRKPSPAPTPSGATLPQSTVSAPGPIAQPTQSAPVLARDAAAPPNIFLISLDTVRADYIHAYGHPTVQTPALDRLASEGARFNRTMVQLPQTDPSHGSILTGMYPSSNGVRVHMVDKLPANLDTLATVLSQAGYQTAALYSWMSFDPQYCQFQRGFQTYRNVAPDPNSPLSAPGMSQAAAGYREAEQYLAVPRLLSEAVGAQHQLEETAKGRADLTTDAALPQLKALAPGPFFFWLHYFDPHYPYEPPQALIDQYDPGYSGPITPTMATFVAIQQAKLIPKGADLKHFESLYLAELTYFDQYLSSVLSQLDALGLTDSTAVFLVGDHGEAFDEHTQEIVNGTDYMHPHSLYNNELRVPLLLRYPARLGPGVVVDAPTQGIDIFPTVMEIAGLRVPDQVQGTSLLPLLDGRDDGSGRAAYAIMADYGFLSVTAQNWKYIRNNASGHEQLFDLSADPGEQNDVADSEPEVRRRLAAQLTAWMNSEKI